MVQAAAKDFGFALPGPNDPRSLDPTSGLADLPTKSPIRCHSKGSSSRASFATTTWRMNGTSGIGSLDVPLVRTQTRDVFFNLDGQQLLDIPAAERMPYARLIGERLFVTTDESMKSWQQYDLRAGTGGKTCETEDLAFSYIASDGTVAIVVGRRSPAQAFDLATCKPLWSIPGSTQGEAKDVWKVNTTLIQRTNDELFSLVAAR